MDNSQGDSVRTSATRSAKNGGNPTAKPSESQETYTKRQMLFLLLAVGALVLFVAWLYVQMSINNASDVKLNELCKTHGGGGVAGDVSAGDGQYTVSCRQTAKFNSGEVDFGKVDLGDGLRKV